MNLEGKKGWERGREGRSIWGREEKILTHATAWMNPENFMLSEISQTQKDKY